MSKNKILELISPNDAHEILMILANEDDNFLHKIEQIALEKFRNSKLKEIADNVNSDLGTL